MKICPACGAKEAETEFSGPFCTACTASMEPAVTAGKDFTVVVCPACGTARAGNESFEYSEQALTRLVSSRTKENNANAVKILLEKTKGGAFIATIESVFKGGDREFKKRSRLKVTVEKRTCKDCTLKSGGYHLALIQLRGDPEQISRLAEKLVKRLEKESFVSGVEEKKEGIDIQVGSAKAAVSALKACDKSFIKTSTLIGAKQGKDVHRITLCVRL